MNRFYAMARPMVSVGLVLIVLALWCAVFQWTEFARTGHVITGYSTIHGYIYGPKFFLLAPFLVAGFGAYFLACTLIARIEITAKSITQYNFLGQVIIAIPWNEVETLKKIGRSSLPEGRFSTKIYDIYAIKSAHNKLEFNERQPNLAELFNAIRMHLPLAAIDKTLPLPVLNAPL